MLLRLIQRQWIHFMRCCILWPQLIHLSRNSSFISTALEFSTGSAQHPCAHSPLLTHIYYSFSSDDARNSTRGTHGSAHLQTDKLLSKIINSLIVTPANIGCVFWLLHDWFFGILFFHLFEFSEASNAVVSLQDGLYLPLLVTWRYHPAEWFEVYQFLLGNVGIS